MKQLYMHSLQFQSASRFGAKHKGAKTQNK